MTLLGAAVITTVMEAPLMLAARRQTIIVHKLTLFLASFNHLDLAPTLPS